MIDVNSLEVKISLEMVNDPLFDISMQIDESKRWYLYLLDLKQRSYLLNLKIAGEDLARN